MKGQKILDDFDKSIWQGKDGYWRTYLKYPDGTNKLIKKKERKDIDKAIIDFTTAVIIQTFKERFDDWIERQILYGCSGNTISKYKYDYKRFFTGYEFEKMKICDITDTDIVAHFRKVLSEKNIPYKALKAVFGYMNNVFEKTIRDRIIDDNPCKYIDLPMLKRFCVEKEKEDAAQRTFSAQETDELIERLHNPTNHNYNMVPYFAIEFARYSGFRVGELAALMWEDIDYEKGYITVRHSEIHDREKNEFYISTTKNHKIRYFPLTSELIDVLQRTKVFEEEHGYLGEYVFQDKNGRIHSNKISSAAYNKSGKSIHALRRSLNSNLKCIGVPTAVAASLLGHTTAVNENNYTYDVTDAKTKCNYVTSAYKSNISNIN